MTASTILVLGDNVTSRRQLRDVLAAGGAKVLLASTMAEAAKCLQSASEVHAVVIDIEDAAIARRSVDHLRELRPGVGVVYVGHTFEAGDEVCVTRPARKEALHDAVQRLLTRRRSA